MEPRVLLCSLFLALAGAANLRGANDNLAHAPGQQLFSLANALEGRSDVSDALKSRLHTIARRLDDTAPGTPSAAGWNAFKSDVSAACQLPKSTSATDAERCSWYEGCLDANIPCGDQGYARDYGKKYCDRFVAQNYTSTAASDWRDATLVCLQNKLAASVTASQPATCSAIADDAFEQHVECYTQQSASICSICSESAEDLAKIFLTVDVAEYGDPRSWQAAYGVLKTCVPQLVAGGAPTAAAIQCAANIQKLSFRVGLEQVGYISEQMGAAIVATCDVKFGGACTRLMSYADKLGEFVLSGGQEVYSLDIAGLPFRPSR